MTINRTLTINGTKEKPVYIIGIEETKIYCKQLGKNYVIKKGTNEKLIIGNYVFIAT